MKPELIPYTPSVLKWARETAGYGIDEIAIKFNKEPAIILEWETGLSSPTYVQLERLAYEILKRPLAIFFFPEPPEEFSPKESFRTLPEYEIEQMPPKFKYILRKAHAMQENLRELNINVNPVEKLITKKFIIDKNLPIENMALRLREYLGVTLTVQQSWKNEDEAFKKWRALLEQNGLFIFKEAFQVETFSGFCIYDEIFPIIYINNSKSKTRQTFTLFHELAHILFKTGGVDTRLADYIDYLGDEEKKIEVYCNKFAASFLVPNDDFSRRIERGIPTEKTLSSLANLYNVSREVILRKFLDMSIVNESFYIEKAQNWADQARKTKEAQRAKNTGNHYATKTAYLGENFMNLVFSKYYQKKISSEQVADYLGVKTNHISIYEAIYLKGDSA